MRRRGFATAWPVLLFALISYASVSDGKDVFGSPLSAEETSVSPLKVGRMLSKTASAKRSKGSSKQSKKSKKSKGALISSKSGKLSKGALLSSKSGKSSRPSLVGKSPKKSSKRTKSSSKTSSSARRRRKGGHATQKKNDSNDLDEILSNPDIAASLGVINEGDLLDVMEAEWGTERVEMEKAMLEGSQQEVDVE